MTESSSANPPALQLTLMLAQDDDSEYRDTKARQLLNLCNDWPGVEQAQLAADAAPEATRAMEAVVSGQLLLKLAPAMLQEFFRYCRQWLGTADAGRVSIKVGDKEAEFPANTSEEQLKAWVRALQASPKALQGETQDEGAR